MYVSAAQLSQLPSKNLESLFIASSVLGKYLEWRCTCTAAHSVFHPSCPDSCHRCGHCKHLVPELAKLGQLIEADSSMKGRVVIAKVGQASDSMNNPLEV